MHFECVFCCSFGAYLWDTSFAARARIEVQPSLNCIFKITKLGLRRSDQLTTEYHNLDPSIVGLHTMRTCESFCPFWGYSGWNNFKQVDCRRHSIARSKRVVDLFNELHYSQCIHEVGGSVEDSFMNVELVESYAFRKEFLMSFFLTRCGRQSVRHLCEVWLRCSSALGDSVRHRRESGSKSKRWVGRDVIQLVAYTCRKDESCNH